MGAPVRSATAMASLGRESMAILRRPALSVMTAK